jgi:hypothetical protein
MTQRRYAEDTRVPVGQSQGEVREMLRRAGAGRIGVMEEPDGAAVLMFEHGARAYRIAVPVRPAKNPDQEQRVLWRLMVLLVKAKLQAVEQGVTTIEREFFADTILPSGKTLIEEARPAITAAMAERGPLRLGWAP